MKRTTTWGLFGAALFVLIGILFAALPYDSMFHDAAYAARDVVLYPVMVVWLTIFKICGIEGDHAMAFILPMLATIFLYLAAIGYGVGALAGRVVRRR